MAAVLTGTILGTNVSAEGMLSPPSGEEVQTIYLEDGTMAVDFPTANYDVLLPDQTDFPADVLERFNTTAGKLSMYLQFSGYDLYAFPKGNSLDSKEGEIKFNIKNNYPGINNWTEVSGYQQVAETSMLSGFDIDGESHWEEFGDYVFVWFEDTMLGKKELRYATIVDEKIIYMILGDEDGTFTETERAVMNQLAASFRLVK